MVPTPIAIKHQLPARQAGRKAFQKGSNGVDCAPSLGTMIRKDTS